MLKRKWVRILALILASLLSVANAGGLLPSADELFGVSLPSVGLAVGREADEEEKTDAGSQETYCNFSASDYQAFGEYLAGANAKLLEYKFENGVMTATVSVKNKDFIFAYDSAQKSAVVIYPSGTRAETELEQVDPGISILPPVGGVMPSAEFAIDRKPDKQRSEDEGTTLEWDSFSDEDYAAFSSYLGETGATANNSIDDGVLSSDISLNGGSIRFVFDWNLQKATVFYPEGTSPETTRWNVLVGSGSLLPDVKEIGTELPSVSRAIEKEPSITEKVDGGKREVYQDFSEEDYKAFSSYLQETGCTVDDYHTEEGGVLVVNISNVSGKMTFSYDALQHTCTVVYPAKARAEKTWVLTPSPVPTATPEPTPRTVTANYSIDQCWDIAQKYFRNLKWNEPSSVKIYNYTWDLTSDDGIFVCLFAINYSAKNSMGGTQQGTYFIQVDIMTGQVVKAFGN